MNIELIVELTTTPTDIETELFYIDCKYIIKRNEGTFCWSFID